MPSAVISRAGYICEQQPTRRGNLKMPTAIPTNRGIPAASAAPTAAAAPPDASAREPGPFDPVVRGHLVLDAELRLLGADEHARAFWPLNELIADAVFVDARTRVLNGETVVEFFLPLPAVNEGGDVPKRDRNAVGVRMSRLDGPEGPLLLITFSESRSDQPMPLDPLTLLPDRRAIAERAEAWRRTAGSAARFAVLFLDLDNFKGINDRHGHAVGDAVLAALAARWLDCVREDDLVSRYGGDEFVLLLRDAVSVAEVEPVIGRLEKATAEPVVVGGLMLSVAATIGWATPASADWTVEALVVAADRDMYARKRKPPR
jgi:diguanylate cyclase (GGDEF)-like protein